MRLELDRIPAALGGFWRGPGGIVLQASAKNPRERHPETHTHLEGNIASKFYTDLRIERPPVGLESRPMARFAVMRGGRGGKRSSRMAGRECGGLECGDSKMANFRVGI